MGVTVEKCLQAWTNSLRQMNARTDMVFFGDSLIYYGDFASALPDKKVCNLGLRGDTLQGMMDRVVQVKLVQPKTVYLMAGINDVSISTVDEFEKRYDALLIQLREQLFAEELVVFNMLPVNDVDFSISCDNEQIVRFNEVIASLCFKHGLLYVNLFSVYERCGKIPKEMTLDGIHLKRDAYNKWYKVLKDINERINIR